MKPIKFDGGKIAVEGIYAGVELPIYHGDLCVGPSISSSGLRDIFLRSPKHYFASSPYNEARRDKKRTAAFIFGDMLHTLLLRDEPLKQRFIVRPGEEFLNRAGITKWTSANKVCAAWERTQLAAGYTIVTPEQGEQLKGMSAELAEHPLVQRAGILNGWIEHSLVWRDRETGVWCKARPDVIPAERMSGAESSDFVDLKSTASIDEDDLASSVFKFGYFQQGAFVLEGWRTLTKEPASTFTLVFVEKTEPYCIAVRTLKDADIERGIRANRVAIRKFADCMERGKWPGPGGDQEDARYIEMPSWSQSRIDARLQLEGM